MADIQVGDRVRLWAVDGPYGGDVVQIDREPGAFPPVLVHWDGWDTPMWYSFAELERA